MGMLNTRVGNYTITDRLAEGGMGEVYVAHHELMDREAVVKVLRPDMSLKKDMVKRFFNEARAATSIHHPGIVEVFDMGFDDSGRAYIVMEKLRGESLSARLARGRMALAQVVALVRQMAGALGAAHQRGIVHRDLKPDNLFIVPDPEVAGGERIKVLDFGIAKLAMEKGGSLMTAAGAIFGTPAYMAPEQCTSTATVDNRADIYALGCILFEMLCGQPPFGHGGLELLAAQLRDPAPAPRSIDPDVPVELEQVTLRMLEKKPEDRFQSCDEIIAALGSVAVDAAAARGVAAEAPAGLAVGSLTPTPDLRSRVPAAGTEPQAAAADLGTQPTAADLGTQPTAADLGTQPTAADLGTQPTAAALSQPPVTETSGQPVAVHVLTTHGASAGEVDLPPIPGEKKNRWWVAVVTVVVVGAGVAVAAVNLGGSNRSTVSSAAPVEPPDAQPAIEPPDAQVSDELKVPEGLVEEPAQKKPADKKPADKKPADKKPADKKPADKKPADKKPADKKPADKKPAEGIPLDVLKKKLEENHRLEQNQPSDERRMPQDVPQSQPPGPALQAAADKAMEAGQRPRAIKLYRQCVNTDRGNCACHRGLTLAQFQNGNRAAARRSFKLYQRDCPNDPDLATLRSKLQGARR